MKDNIAKITKVLLWVLIALSIFFALMLFTNTTDEDTTWISNSLTFTEIILYLTAGAVVLASLYIFTMKLIAKPKRAMISLIPIVLVLIIFLIAKSQASDALLEMPNYDGDANVPSQLKWTGTGLIMMYVLLGLASVSIIYAEVSKLFK